MLPEERIEQLKKRIQAQKHIFENSLNQISNFIQSLNLNIDHVVLYGSYGRNEGALIKDNENYHLYNDIDLIFVLDNYLDNKVVLNIKSVLSKKFGIKWIDISQLRKSKLRNLKPSIYNFDLKFGSKVIVGEENILSEIPNFKPYDITLKDVEVLYFTRLWTFLGSFDEGGLKKHRYDKEARFFKYQMSKALLAIIDILLLQKSTYHQSYVKRLELFASLYPNKHELIDLGLWALGEKLFPSNSTITSEELFNLYSKVHHLYKKEMYTALSKFYNKNVSSTDDIKRALYTSSSEAIMRLRSLIKFKNLHYEKKLKINIAQSYIFEAFSSVGNFNQDYLTKAASIIKKYNKQAEKYSNNWDQLRTCLANLRMTV